MFSFFDKLKNTVSKTAQALVGNVVNAVSDEEGDFYYLVIPKEEETIYITLKREDGRDSYFDYDFDFVEVQTEEALEYLEKYLFK